MMPNRRFEPQWKHLKKKLLKSSDKTVVNLSDHCLTTDEKTLLSRGLSFCPQPPKADDILIHRDTLLFSRRLRLKHWFKDTEQQKPDPFASSTGWTPPSGKSLTLDTYINVVTNEILKYKSNPPKCQNLTEEANALLSLSQNKSLVIKPADKGGAIVIMNRTDYINEGLRQLQDLNFYKLITRDPTRKTAADINNFLTFLKDRKLLPVQHIQYLTTKNPRTPIFYMLPKIHKPNNPGRPIVSGCDGPTEKLSAYVDSYIKPLAQKVNSYLQDINQFLQKMNELGQIPANSFLATIDVVALYTNIPHRDGILAVKEALESHAEKQPLTWVLLRMLHLVLTRKPSNSMTNTTNRRLGPVWGAAALQA